MLCRSAAEYPQRLLQVGAERVERLAAEHHLGVLEPGVRHSEVVQQVRQRLLGDDDRQVVGGGEVRQAQASRWMALREHDVLIGAVHGAPAAHAALQRPPHARPQVGVTAQQFLEDRHCAQLRRALQQRDDVLGEDAVQWIGTAAAPDRRFLGRQPGVGLDAVGAGGADRRLGGGHRRLVVGTQTHVVPHVVVGQMSARHGCSLWGDSPQHPYQTPGRLRSPAVKPRAPPRGSDCGPETPSRRQSRSPRPPPRSQPPYSRILILIVAAFSS